MIIHNRLIQLCILIGHQAVLKYSDGTDFIYYCATQAFTPKSHWRFIKTITYVKEQVPSRDISLCDLLLIAGRAE